MIERKNDLYRVQSETPGPAAGPQHEPAHVGRGGGFRGQGHGGGFGHGEGFGCGRGLIVCYNCGAIGNYDRDCQNPTTTCKYCKSYDHTIEECPILIAKIRDPKLVVNQNIQLIAAEKKEPEPSVNVVTCSGASTSSTSWDDENNTGPKWVRKAIDKSTPLDLQKNKETFQQAKTFFTDPTPSGLQIFPCRGVSQQKYCGVSPVQISQATAYGRCE